MKPQTGLTSVAVQSLLVEVHTGAIDVACEVPGELEGRVEYSRGNTPIGRAEGSSPAGERVGGHDAAIASGLADGRQVAGHDIDGVVVNERDLTDVRAGAAQSADEFTGQIAVTSTVKCNIMAGGGVPKNPCEMACVTENIV